MKSKPFIPFVLGLLLAGQVLMAQTTVTGKVIQVSSGDTFTLMDIHQREYTVQEEVEPWGVGEELDLDPPPQKIPTIIHMAEIDAPELNQPYGENSRKALAAKIMDRVVRVAYWEKDRFDHIVGTVYLGDCWVNKEVLDEGWAWHDKRYSDNDELDTAEQLARARRIGLWAQARPVEPWKWRQTHQIVMPEYTNRPPDIFPP